MYFSELVNVPDVPGKIVFRKKYKSVYVHYEVGREYKKDKQYTIPKRVIIGKKKEGEENKMYPNENYLKYFSFTPLQVVREEAYRSCSLKVGAFIVLNSIVEEYKLKEYLEPSFGNNASFLLDLALYSIVTEDNAAQHYPDYAFNHPLLTNKMKIYSDSYISEFLKNVTTDMRIDFLNRWNENRDKKQKIYISYDSTNKNCQAGDISLVEFGNAKDDNSIPIINFSIAFDQTNKVPLTYETYPGSINDLAQLSYFVSKLNEYDYRSIGLILDRGYFSKDNIIYAESKGYSLVIMSKGKKEFFGLLIDAVRGTFEDKFSCKIPNYHVYGTTVRRRVFSSDTKDRFVHIFFSVDIFTTERITFESRINDYIIDLNRRVGNDYNPTDEIEKYFELYYTDVKDKKGNKIGRELVSYSQNEGAISKTIKRCGYFVIITTEEMTAEEAFYLYKGRDSSEKLFRADKSFLGARSQRCHTEERAQAKFFIEFIALIIRNRVHNLIKDYTIKIGKRSNLFNVSSAISELEKLELVRVGNGSYTLDHSPTRVQKQFFQAFGISDNALSDSINSIISILDDEEKKAEEKRKEKKSVSAEENNDEDNDDDDEDDDSEFSLGEGAEIEENI